MNTERKPLDRLRHHVSGAIARGEKEAITERKPVDVLAVMGRMEVLAGQGIPLSFRATHAEALAAVAELIEAATPFREVFEYRSREEYERLRSALARCGVQS